MSFNAIFYTFAKKQNSTAQPSGTGTTLSVELKENCSVVNPILRVYNTANFNPSDLNYCYINKFARYYWVEDWEYGVGEWLAHLRSDPLASFKAGIGALSKYVLRSAYKENKDIIDTFYPATASRISNAYTDSFSFWTVTNLTGYHCVLGIANTVLSDTGPVCYYSLNDAQLENLLYEMLPPSSIPWSQGFTGLTDTLYRSIYDPYSYIKSCKLFPFYIDETTRQAIEFGNYTSTVTAGTIKPYFSDWVYFSHEFSLPSGWTSLEACYRTNPNCHMYFIMNPFGVIELNPLDFYNSNKMRAQIDVDLISGNALLKLYKVISANTEEFLTQSKAPISVDVPLTASSINADGLIRGGLHVLQAVGNMSASNIPASISAIGNASLSTVEGVIPSIQSATGQANGDARFLTGDATLMITQNAFTEKNTAEFGKPLCETHILSSLPGYIKCADGDNDAIGCMYIEEREQVGQHLTNGFYYE